MTIIHRQFRRLNDRPANLRRPLLFAPTVMTCSHLRQSFPCFVQQSSALKVRLLSFSIFFQRLSCLLVRQVHRLQLFSYIVSTLFSSIQLLVFSFWKDLQPEFPTFSQFLFSCVQVLWLLCRQVAFAFLFPVPLCVPRLVCCISTLFQSKTFWLPEYRTWSIQVSMCYNQNFLLAWLFYKTIKSISSQTNIVSTGCVSNRFNASSFVSKHKSFHSLYWSNIFTVCRLFRRHCFFFWIM